MSQISCINLTYQSPCEDVINSMGINPDGTTNIKYTLTSIRNLLQHNVNVLNSLMAEVDNITDIIPVGFDMVAVKFSSDAVQKKLLENNTLIIPQIDNIDDDDDENYFIDDGDDETNFERLNMVNHLVDQNVIPANLEILSQSDSDSDNDEIVGDNPNIAAIVNKYQHIINNSESEYDSLDSDYYSED